MDSNSNIEYSTNNVLILILKDDFLKYKSSFNKNETLSPSLTPLKGQKYMQNINKNTHTRHIISTRAVCCMWCT